MGPLQYGGLGIFGGQKVGGLDPRMLDPLTKSISQFYGQEKMGPFRQELMGLIQENFPEFAQGGIMGGLSMDQINMISGGKPAYTEGGGSFHSDAPSNIGANNNPFANSIKPIGLGSLMGYK